MFKLELDVLLYFVPPMTETGRGIAVTKTLELPFGPATGMFLTGFTLNEANLPMGFKIEEVTWDLDRSVFLATTSLTEQGLPVACIPYAIQGWIDRGWRFGSYEDNYDQEDDRPRTENHEPIEIDWDWDDEDELAKWQTLSPRSRPPAFNALFGALIREMVMRSSPWETAYAMDRTKMLFDKEQLQKGESRAVKKFKDALVEYDRMSFDEQFAWRQRVIRRHPSLSQFLS